MWVQELNLGPLEEQQAFFLMCYRIACQFKIEAFSILEYQISD